MSGGEEITLGYSPCPNDTFIFCALAGGTIDTRGVQIRPVIEDVEALNRRAERSELDLTKISFHAFARLQDRYSLLSAGAALGRGCGPLVVAREPLAAERFQAGAGELTIAIPGELTTAALLLRLFAPRVARLLVRPFERIFEAVLTGEADLGVIIHEGRFTYQARGLHQVVDLGEWWEARTGLPIPLGGIIAARRLGEPRIEEIEGWVRESVRWALGHRSEALPYVRTHAQEMDDRVVQAHIDLYVNHFTVDLGSEGRRAVAALLEMAQGLGIRPRPPEPGAAGPA
jgi:1,4-dihydroxy-6-naphthoate synthase